MLTNIDDYKDLIDRQVINEYEKKEQSGSVKIIDSNKIIKTIKKKEKSISDNNSSTVLYTSKY